MESIFSFPHFFISSCFFISSPTPNSASDKNCLKGNLIFVHYKMINLDSITNENNENHNEKWPYIPYHPYRILIIGGSGSGKTNTLLNLIKEQDHHDFNDKIYLYAKYLSEPKYEYLIKKREVAGIKNVNNPNAFIVCSNTMNDVYEDINNYNPKRNKKALIVFDDMIADIMRNKKFQAIIKELFIRWRKLIILFVLLLNLIFLFQKM